MFAFVASLATCQCGGGDAKPAGEAQPERNVPAAAPSRAAPPAPRNLPGPIAVSSPLTVDEATQLIPPHGARTLVPAAETADNRGVRIVECVDAHDLAAAGDAIANALRAAAWQQVSVRPGEKVAIAAAHDDARVSFTIEADEGREGCDGGKGQFLVTVALAKVQSAP